MPPDIDGVEVVAYVGPPCFPMYVSAPTLEDNTEALSHEVSKASVGSRDEEGISRSTERSITSRERRRSHSRESSPYFRERISRCHYINKHRKRVQESERDGRERYREKELAYSNREAMTKIQVLSNESISKAGTCIISKINFHNPL